MEVTEMIDFVDVTKIYKGENEVVALKDINLTIPKGEIFGIIGLSGAGKSTLVRCINLLEKPDRGVVRVNGVDMTSLSPKELREERKKIGMIFQHFNLLSSRTVSENIAFPLELSGVSKQETDKRVAELLNLVALSDKANAYPSQLSGGQKQRVGIARALANNQEIILCDEATSALDPQTTMSILRLLKKINKERGITIVIITHEMNVIKEICDSVAVIEDGEIIETGPVTDVLLNPVTDTAKTFLKGVVKTEVPKEVEERLKAQNGGELIQVTFLGGSTGEPLINEMVRNFDVAVNILYGNIDQIKEITFGMLVLKITGPECEKAKAFLKEKGLKVKVIGNA
jgi:D-methionine transport system ATP-binding protein